MTTANTPPVEQRMNLVGEEARRAAAPSTLAVAVGGALTLFGTLITLFSEGGRVPGLVVLTVGLLVLTAGVRRLRALTRMHKYRVTRRFSPGLFLFAVGTAAALVLASFLLAWVLDIKAAGLLLAIPPLIIPLYTGLRTAVIMTRIGIGANGSNLPWSEIARVEVTHAGGDEAEFVVVRHDPNVAPNRFPVQGSKLDPARFAEAATRFVPAATAVVVNGQPLSRAGRAR